MIKSIQKFTLSEVAFITALVIIIIFVLFRYTNLNIQAKQLAANRIASMLASDNATNYIARKLNPAKGAPVLSCQQAANALPTGLPANYSINVTVPQPPNTVLKCILFGPNGTTATFTIITAK